MTWAILWSVIVSGLIDSYNPCAITVLLLFIGLMFSLQKSRKTILAMGFFYIISVYLSYFLIGLGVMKLFLVFGIPHLMAYIGGVVSIIFGLWNIKDYYIPNFGPQLKISIGSRQVINEWAHKATIPAAIIVGLLVGVTEFPCSGAIYLAIISLVATKASFWNGVLYLLIYNIMFILPLIIIFFIASNRLVIEKMTAWQEMKGFAMKLVLGFTMIVLGIVLLIIV